MPGTGVHFRLEWAFTMERNGCSPSSECALRTDSKAAPRGSPHVGDDGAESAPSGAHGRRSPALRHGPPSGVSGRLREGRVVRGDRSVQDSRFCGHRHPSSPRGRRGSRIRPTQHEAGAASAGWWPARLNVGVSLGRRARVPDVNYKGAPATITLVQSQGGLMGGCAPHASFPQGRRPGGRPHGADGRVRISGALMRGLSLHRSAASSRPPRGSSSR
jgi:hypothetical protein